VAGVVAVVGFAVFFTCFFAFGVVVVADEAAGAEEVAGA
jgi:hypothetical protein